ncbi:MAG: hypothetical protein R3F34_07755 [Planctomycetota bacterium]
MSFLKGLATAAAAGVAMAGTASADVLVTSDIATSTTWTADNVYNLQTQIYVLPGATLTIEPGTIIASDTGMGGSLAVTQGAKIIVNGTKTDPVIMTSKADQATWVNGDPRFGTWREACSEWGNPDPDGQGLRLQNATPGNTNTFSATELRDDGRTGSAGRAPQYARYGGGDDDDDSGELHYLSIRYGGTVIAVGDELSGDLSMGGIGRGTDVDHIEIMNNVDDSIETWGGTVNYKYVSIWNIGDDSFDVDQGWRGKASSSSSSRATAATMRRAQASVTTASRRTAPSSPTTSRSPRRPSGTARWSVSRASATTARLGATTLASSTTRASSWTWASSS